MKKINAFTMSIDAPDAILVAVLQDGLNVTATARLRGTDGNLQEDAEINPVFGDNPYAVLLEMLESVEILAARRCGIFIKSPLLAHWFLVERMQCRLRTAKETTKIKVKYSKPWSVNLPLPCGDPRWMIPLKLFSYSEVGLWRVKDMKSTAKLHLDRYGKVC